MDPGERLELARGQLAKVQTSWFDPTDWSDLTIYGMHACENAAMAAADKVAIPWKKTHWHKVDVAIQLHKEHGLPDIADLLKELNELRKGFSYGELTVRPSMSAEYIAGQVEEYVESVAKFLEEEENE